MRVQINQPTLTGNSLRMACKAFRRGLWLLLTTALLASTLTAQNEKDAPALELGKPIERELAGDQSHSYSIALTAGQYLHVVVDQRGIDVVVTLFGPDGKKLAEVDSPNGTEGPEPILMIAETAGSYRLEVRSLDAKAQAGRYQAKVEELRAAQPQDKSRIAAQQALAEAEQFRSAGSADSLRKAIDRYEAALPVLRAAKESATEAETLNSMGLVYSNLAEKQKALDYLNRALPLLRAVGDRSGEAVTLNNIGYVYDTLGEKQKALDYYNQALPLLRAVGNRRFEADILNNIGYVYHTLGEMQKALDYYSQALPLKRAVGDRQGEAVTLDSIGFFYDALGEKQKALDYYNQALPLFRAVGDRRFEATTLTNIGAVYNALGEKQKALDYFNHALPLFRAVGDLNGEAATLDNIGAVYRALGEKQKALDFYDQALALHRVTGNRYFEASTLTHIGVFYNSLGEKQKALDLYNQALPLNRAVGDRSGEADTLASIAIIERDRGNLSEARVRIEEALTIVESLRTKIASQELRSSYFATVQQYYDFYIDLLMRFHQQQPSAGLDGTALQASERRRARSLLETLAEANSDIRQGVDPTLVARERSLQQQLDAKAQAQTRLLSGKHTDAQAETIAKEIETLSTEFQQVEAQIRETSPHYAALTQPQPLTLKQIQTQVLDQDTLLLEYSLGEERSYLWAVTVDSVTSYELPKRETIERTAREVYALLTDPRAWSEDSLANRRGLGLEKANSTGRPSRGSASKRAASVAHSPEALVRLSQLVLAPIGARLGKKRLVVVADGALQFIPFASLPIPTAGRQSGKQPANIYRPLIAEHEIIGLPSASTLAVLRNEVRGRKPAAKSIAIFADPVFERSDVRFKGKTVKNAQSNGDVAGNESKQRGLRLEVAKSANESGVTGADLHIPRLPGTRKEAEQILSLVPPNARQQAFDFSANRATASSADLSQYRYLHFATHGFLDSQHPELSGILLSMFDETGEPQDGFLRAHEIFNLKLPAELVVLSACRTGLGKEVKGEGVVSLTRGFMYAGSPRVVVSLWSVSDVGTAELMVRFYKGMLKERLRPAQALQAAQVSMFKEKRFASPFYWAAFTLQGEWR